ncbi:MAG: glycerate kinase [Nitrososphaerota archaeon]|nr:glycerate kinase [Candidatus Bathyarchaeota archaeon]MDW8062183.1 glycerate kinase [Nitrososphaerota archaeon]
MRIRSPERIIGNASCAEDKTAREVTIELLEKALEASDPRIAVRRSLKISEDKLSVMGVDYDLTKYHRILVVGGGKASGAMAEALEEILGERIDGGVVNVPRGVSKLYNVKRVRLNEAGHPIPDDGGVRGVSDMLDMLRSSDENTLVFCLLSGGGSALMSKPIDSVSLEDLQKLTSILLRCGAPIEDVNAVRKHLSQVKGGRLAAAAYPATIISLIVSDVVGDRLDTIASGPTAPDTTTYEYARSILQRYRVWDTIPDSVRKAIESGCTGTLPETPKPGDHIFRKVYNFIIAGNSIALEEMEKYAIGMGYNVVNLSSYIEGEARYVGYTLAGILKGIVLKGRPTSRPAIILAGGETTVTVTGNGVGGRNQELTLAASIKIRGLRGVAIASMGTDGVDGPTDAAGAIADGYTYERALTLGLKPEEYLDRNDSYSFFSRLGDCIFTGPTGTNVNDVIVMTAV